MRHTLGWGRCRARASGVRRRRSARVRNRSGEREQQCALETLRSTRLHVGYECDRWAADCGASPEPPLVSRSAVTCRRRVADDGRRDFMRVRKLSDARCAARARACGLAARDVQSRAAFDDGAWARSRLVARALQCRRVARWKSDVGLRDPSAWSRGAATRAAADRCFGRSRARIGPRRPAR